MTSLSCVLQKNKPGLLHFWDFSISFSCSSCWALICHCLAVLSRLWSRLLSTVFSGVLGRPLGDTKTYECSNFRRKEIGMKILFGSYLSISTITSRTYLLRLFDSAMAVAAISPLTLSATCWFPHSDKVEKNPFHVVDSDIWQRDSTTSFTLSSEFLVSWNKSTLHEISFDLCVIVWRVNCLVSDTGNITL